MKNMKLLFAAVSVITIFTFCQCKKNKPDSNGLPAATQEGKNTIGFLLNGQPWKPQGVRGTGNLSIDYDPGFNQGIVGIVAYNFVPAISQQLTIGIKDSLNFINAPVTFALSNHSLFGISYSSDCDLFSTYSDVVSSGSMTITKLDRTNRIISGTFNATLSKTGCAEIKITEGRFDMKF
jgi:hypothetical protein